MALQPVTHSLTVTVTVTEAETTTFRNRLESLYGGSIGTLSVPGFPSVSQTVFVGQPSWSEQKKSDNLDGDETERYIYDVTLEIMEL